MITFATFVHFRIVKILFVQCVVSNKDVKRFAKNLSLTSVDFECPSADTGETFAFCNRNRLVNILNIFMLKFMQFNENLTLCAALEVKNVDNVFEILGKCYIFVPEFH